MERRVKGSAKSISAATSVGRRSFACDVSALLLGALCLPAKGGLAAGRDLAEADRGARARSWFTDTAVTDQDSTRHRFYSDLVAGRAVLINSMFVGCSSACPLLTRHLVSTRALLGDRFGRDIGFLSISVDPLSDTPEVLKRFAQKHGADAPAWRFVTGGREAIALILGRLGLWVDAPNDHKTLLIAGNAGAGRWAKLRPESRPDELVQQLGRFMDAA